MDFTPDFHNIVDCANNLEAKRLPLYEHSISPKIMEQITGKEFAPLENGDDAELGEFMKHYCGFFRQMGYDTVSYEQAIGPVLPGSGALGNHADGVIKTRADFANYPWEQIPGMYFQKYGRFFHALKDNLPDGMKAIGGVGYGVFEAVQDVTGYVDLCYLSYDDPELYADLFQKMGEVSLAIWSRFLEEFGDLYCICRFGDDLGYKDTTLLPESDIKRLIIPQYTRIIQRVHQSGKPFLLHSCGNIFNVMEDLISVAKIDAKHSNEDQIAPFPQWVEQYGDRIGNFGGIDTDAVCRLGKPELKEYITGVIHKCTGHGGFAFGSGNSIPDYVPAEHYLWMVETVREWRKE